MKIFLVKLIKGGNGSIPNWFRFDFLSHFLLSSFSIDFGSTIDRNQSTLIEVINSMSAEKSKSIEIDRNQIVPSLCKSVLADQKPTGEHVLRRGWETFTSAGRVVKNIKSCLRHIELLC